MKKRAGMKEFIDILENEQYAKNQVKRITASVDRQWEISAVMRRIIELYPQEKRPAVIFENVKGSNVPLITGVFLNRTRYAIALETKPQGITERWVEALERPIEPKRVSNSPCKENKWTDEEIDLGRFPVPNWTPDIDPAPFITAPCVVTRDPSTHHTNVGVYRIMIKGKNKTGININPGQSVESHLRKYQEMNKPMPVAIAIGCDPSIYMVACAKVQEEEIAGGLVRRPIDVVKCETSDLEVPADSEVVIEGEIPPFEQELEGPFGEFTGYIGAKRNNPVINIKCITFRNNPIFHALVSQKPPSESSLLRGISYEGILFHNLKYIRGLKGIHVTEAGASHFVVVASIKRMFPGHAKQVMNAIWGVFPTLAKFMIVVDDDVDINDPDDVQWAVATRVQPERDVTIMKGCQGLILDQSKPMDDPYSSKMGIDATKKHEFQKVALPDEKYMKTVKEKWKEYGVDQE